MYNIKLSDAIPTPMPASTDRIVAAHYYSAWKKGAAQIHGGFDDLHGYPERTPLMGYYDEENPDVCDWEIKWAVEHGVNCFIHCWYRLKENVGKPVTVDKIRCGHGLHEALFNAKFQKYMKFAIMYENARARWGGTSPDDLMNNLLPFWVDNYFSRDNYLKIDDKPVLFVCGKNEMDEDLAPVENQREIFDKCREYLKARGFGGLIIATCVWNYGVAPEVYESCVEHGYDFHFGYNAGYSPKDALPPDDEIIEGQCGILEKRFECDPMRTIPTATCFRDAAPRCTPHWDSMGFRFERETPYHLTPDGFRKVVRRMKAAADKLPEGAWGKRIFMIDNWNEWDEGHYISPSVEYGFRYLEAIRAELTDCDNLPDYRMPQDIGFTGYNRSWGEPDLSEVCKKKFGVTYN